MRPRKAVIPDFAKLANRFTQFAEHLVTEKVATWADQERQAFVRRIKNQDFPAFRDVPLSWRTLSKKRALHLSLMTMISTGEYVNAINVYRQPLRTATTSRGKRKYSGTRIVVGIHPNKRARDEATHELRHDVSLQMVARIHEYGAPRANIPARPHWGPHLLSMHSRARKFRRSLAQLVIREWDRRMQPKSKP